MWDLPGQDEYNLVRAKCYEQCNFDVIVMCFAVDLRDSFDNLQYKWMEEYKQYVPKSPLIILGCKADLREDGNSEHVTKSEGEKFAKEIGAACYMECSATSPDTVSTVIKKAISVNKNINMFILLLLYFYFYRFILQTERNSSSKENNNNSTFFYQIKSNNYLQPLN